MTSRFSGSIDMDEGPKTKGLGYLRGALDELQTKLAEIEASYVHLEDYDVDPISTLDPIFAIHKFIENDLDKLSFKLRMINLQEAHQTTLANAERIEGQIVALAESRKVYGRPIKDNPQA